MIFQYQALDRTGKNVSDYIDAPSEMSARQKIRSQGLYLVKLKKHEITSIQTAPGEKMTLKAFAQRLSDIVSLKLSTKQLGLFSRQLATLLKAGLPLPVAIADIVEQIDNKHFKNVVADLKEKLEQGSSFSNALAQHRAIFPDMYVSMVRVGESLGSLDQVIARLADMEEKQNILTSKIRSVMYYPAFMLLFAMAVTMFLMTSVIPTIAGMFEEQQKALPFVTRLVIGVSSLLSNGWVLLGLFVLAGILGYAYYRYIHTPEGRRTVDDLKLKVPLAKNLYRRLIVYRFTQNLGILLNNKVDIIKSFEIVKKIVGNVIIEEKISEAALKIKEGASVANALSKSDFLPKLVLGMITAGEASDNLDTMLLNIGNVYETELDLSVTSLTSLIEPVVIIIMGLVIALIVMSVILPITQMNMLLQ
ncbi:MAG TPA: type II secretion system F family protein [Spirochaetota bacterium]|nr:type II secretion system F family protein [Spirochaetota bacterium]HPV41855.1 type II secretion system F family protein [Spirochaetota bacterium]